MTLYGLKSRFQALLRPMVRRMAEAGVTANQVTLAAMLGSLLLGWWLASRGGPSTLFLLLPAWLFLRMALNAVDGMLAREHGQKSNLGGYLNEFADVVSDAALYAPFALVAPFTPGWVGAVVVLSIVSEYAGVLGPSRRYDGPLGKSDRALVFGALGLWVGLAGALPDFAFWLMPLLALLLFVSSYVKPQYLTHDPARIASYRADPLISRPIAVNILLDLYAAADRIVADARANTIPTQLLISGADWVVHHAPQHRFFERLGTPVKERHVLPGFFHDTLGERDRALALAPARRFLLERFAAPLDRPSLLDADHMGFTRDEADALASPLPALSPRGLYWSTTRASLRLAGKLSEGIALGHETGFDSGSTLDYVYRNEARGLGPIGRMIDRNYLDSPGWTGIRQRKLHVEELVRAAMARLAAQGLPIRVIDIAAGHGRYVLEALQGAPHRPESILLRDYSDINVAAGTRMIAEKNLGDITRFIQADAFDRDSIAATSPAPTLGIVSGLYELFPDNAMIRRSLAGLAAVIPSGGALVYTGQPWHPQLELIARALTSHRQGQAWVMRRRVQAEMDALVAEAGFRKIEQRIDGMGIFTVSRAERL